MILKHYDNIYRLTSETRTGTNPYTITYQYDSVGNRTQMIKNGVTTSYTYNNNNQLLTETAGGTTTTYSYDGNGNLLSKIVGGNTTSYAWDWNNHLLSVSEPAGNTLYAYDGDGTRISKTQAGVKTKYINDVARGLVQVLMETNSTGTVQAVYNYGNDLISMTKISGISEICGYYHYDGLGSTRQLTNSSGAVTVSYMYDSYGNLIASSGTVVNAYGFTGEQQFGEADGLVFLRARYYKPSIGRFINRDPILTPIQIKDYMVWLLPYLINYPQHLHSYVYVANNPVNMIDPYGLSFGSWLRDKGRIVWETFKAVFSHPDAKELHDLHGNCNTMVDNLRQHNRDANEGMDGEWGWNGKDAYPAAHEKGGK